MSKVEGHKLEHEAQEVVGPIFYLGRDQWYAL